MPAIKGNLIISADGSATGGGASLDLYNRHLAAHPEIPAGPAGVAQKQALATYVRNHAALLDWVKDGITAVVGTTEAKWQTIYELDLTKQATQDFLAVGDGLKTIDGLAWTWLNSVNASASGIINGQGLVIAQNENQSGFIVPGYENVAASLKIPLQDLIPNFNPALQAVRVLASFSVTNAIDGEGVILAIEDDATPGGASFQTFYLEETLFTEEILKAFLCSSSSSNTDSRAPQSFATDGNEDILGIIFDPPSGFVFQTGATSAAEVGELFPGTLAHTWCSEYIRPEDADISSGDFDTFYFANHGFPRLNRPESAHVLLGMASVATHHVNLSVTFRALRVQVYNKLPSSTGSPAITDSGGGGGTGDNTFLQGPAGPQGPPGPSGSTGTAGADGLGYGGTSTVTAAIASTGTYFFSTQSGLAYAVGSRVRAASSASPTNFVEGIVTAYASALLTLAVDASGGSGTFSSWNFSIAGQAGAAGTSGTSGTNGAGYGGTSTTSKVVASSGTFSITTQAGLAYVVGSRVRLASSASPTNYVEGVVTSYSSTTLVFTADNSGGSGTFASWNLSLAGDKGTGGGGGGGGSGGRIAPFTSTSSPVARYDMTEWASFPVPADLSGNGFDMTLEHGSSKYSPNGPSIGGFFFDSSTNLFVAAPHATLQLTGAMSFGAIFLLTQRAPTTTIQLISSHAAAGETSDTNYLWRVGIDENGNIGYLSEHGPGTNDNATDTSIIVPVNQPVHLVFTRSASGSLKNYVNGRLTPGGAFGPVTLPTDGSSGLLRLGGGTLGSSEAFLNGVLSSYALYASELTAAQVLTIYNETFGPAFGTKA